MMWMERWKSKAAALKKEVHALSLACFDARTPWPAKILALGVVGYVLCPVDFIPDFIPVLGYLDDLVLVPLGIVLVRKMIPNQVVCDCQRIAASEKLSARRIAWVVLRIVVLIWLMFAVAIVYGIILWLF